MTARKRTNARKKTAGKTTKKRVAKKKITKKKTKKRVAKKKITKKKTKKRAAKKKTAKKKTKKRAAKKKITKKKAKKRAAKKKTTKKKAIRKRTTAKKSPPKKSPSRRTSAAMSTQPAAAAPAASKRPSVAAGFPRSIGSITHFYPHVGAGIVAVDAGELRVGDTVHIRGHTTDYYQRVDRIELDHQAIEVARPGQVVGLHVSQRVREGDAVSVVST